MKYLAIFCRWVFGLVFMFSGFVKAIDPWGSAYKIQDYLEAAGMSFPDGFVLGLSFLLCCFEFTLGMAWLLGLFHRFSAWAGLLIISFFTALTFIIALTNPVSDCGCFGDALILTNWQTFFKNILLLGLASGAFLFRKKNRPSYSPGGEFLWLAICAAGIFLVSLYGYRHLPLMDFRPYKVGTHISTQMTLPEDAGSNQYNIRLYYEKDGQVKEFTEENYPWQDTTWIFHSRKVEMISSVKPPIHDFSLVLLPDQQDITDEVLADSAYTFILIAPRLDQADLQTLMEANEWADGCRNAGYRFICATSSPPSVIDSLSRTHGLRYSFVLADEITLKTIIRSHPGLLMLKDGVIHAKWGFRDIPSPSLVLEQPSAFALARLTTQSRRYLLMLTSLTLVFVCYLFVHSRKRSRARSRYTSRKVI